jgi:hypothetical protein
VTEHPTELFAEYVDGALSNEQRAVVEAHAAACAACREELRLAPIARAALASIPEQAVPLGLSGRVVDRLGASEPELQAAGRPQVIRARFGERAYRLVAVGAAAAVVLLLALVALPNLGTGDDGRAPPGGAGLESADREAMAPAEGAAAAEDLLTGPLYERRDVDYDAAAVQAIAETVAGARPDPGAGLPEADPGDEGLTEALECLARGAQAPLGRPVKLLDAAYQGTPAFIGVFLEGPGADRPPAAVVIWIVDRRTCTVLSLAEQRI